MKGCNRQASPATIYTHYMDRQPEKQRFQVGCLCVQAAPGHRWSVVGAVDHRLSNTSTFSLLESPDPLEVPCILAPGTFLVGDAKSGIFLYFIFIFLYIFIFILYFLFLYFIFIFYIYLMKMLS